jgi:hypothetical protein
MDRRLLRRWLDAPSGQVRRVLCRGRAVVLRGRGAVGKLVRWDHSTEQQTLLGDGSIGDYLVDDTHLYWVGADQKSILSMAATGDEQPRTLATIDNPSGSSLLLLADDAPDPNVFYLRQAVPGGSNLGPGGKTQIIAISKAAGTPSLVIGPTILFSNIAADDTHFYWVTVPPGTGDFISEFDLVRTPKTGGGSVDTIAQFAREPAGEGTIRVDACSVYVVMPDGLVAYPKP